MSTESLTRPSAWLPAGHYRFAGLARMEWIKLRSLRSTRWTAAVSAVIMVGLGILVLRFVPSHWDRMSRADRASFDPVNSGFTGLALAQLAAAALGALVVTGEFSSGLIRTTLAAAPGRVRLVAAKALVFTLAALVIGEVLALVTFLAGQAMLHGPAPRDTLASPGAARAVVLAGAYLALIGLIGMGAGLIVRHSAGAIAAAAGVILVLPPITLAFPQGMQHAVQRFLPEIIAENSLTVTKAVPYSLSAWAGLGMLALYAAAVLGAGTWLLARRDA
jgi:ABC-type transport system involved in multi-copper enzyme maturation permease subunit